MNCPQCNASLDICDNLDTFYCKYCGQKIILNDPARRDAKIRIMEMKDRREIHDAEMKGRKEIHDSEMKNQREIHDRDTELEYTKLDYDREERDKKRKHHWFSLLFLLFTIIAAGVVWFAWNNTAFPDVVGRKIDSSMELIEVPGSASSYEGKNYRDVVASFRDAGFTNITTQAIKDLTFGILTKDGSVEDVYINGRFEFSIGEKFQKNAKIIVKYHTKK